MISDCSKFNGFRKCTEKCSEMEIQRKMHRRKGASDPISILMYLITRYYTTQNRY